MYSASCVHGLSLVFVMGVSTVMLFHLGVVIFILFPIKVADIVLVGDAVVAFNFSFKVLSIVFLTLFNTIETVLIVFVH